MGFKDLCKFNDAMLAKQVWRLVHDKDSLFYKVFKTKLFPNSTIFEAKSTNGSYAWRSILKARKVISPRTSLGTNALVAELIHPVSSWWDSRIIDSNFLPFKAQKIKAIPISSIAPEDINMAKKQRQNVLCQNRVQGSVRG